jgi:DHA1 family bicyclomycin/chloramphenicol resistance-like MFS transporter
MTMVVLSPMAIDIYLASVPLMVVDLKTSANQIQSTIGLFFFAMGIGQLVVGPLADRWGRKPIVLFGLALYAVSALLASFAEHILFMQLCRLVQGFAACAISVIIFSVVRDIYTYERSSKVYSYLNGVLSVVPALAPVFGGLLAGAFGWRSTFIFMSIYALLVFVLILGRLPETLKVGDKAAAYSVPLYNWQRFSSILKSKTFVFYSLCCMSAMAGILSYVSYAPVWLISHLNVSAFTFSLLFGFNASVSIACSFLAPILIKRYGNRKVVFVALCSMLCSALALLIAYALLGLLKVTGLLAALGFMLPIALLSTGLSLLLGPATSIALAQFSDRAATASALLGFIQMVGASIVVMLIQQVDLLAPVAVAAVLLVMVLPLFVVMQTKGLKKWSIEEG